MTSHAENKDTTNSTNAAALTERYNKYKDRIHAYIYRRTGDQSLTEDLTAQVFLKMLEAVEKDKAWNSSFSGWLYRIAGNLVIDYYRQQDRRPKTDFDELIEVMSSEDPEGTVIKSIIADVLRGAVSKLTEEQAAVITLRFLEGYHISEVAEMLEKTEGSIKALQYRALVALRQLLLGQEEELTEDYTGTVSRQIKTVFTGSDSQ